MGNSNSRGGSNNGKPLEPNMPWCSIQTPSDTVNAAATGTQKAWIPPDIEWKDSKKLHVAFLNVDQLENCTMDGEPINTYTILYYANSWSDMGGKDIPSFVKAKHGEQAEIRVSFNKKGVCNSYMGTKARNISAPKPTMNLDLDTGCCSDQYKRYLIIHEFGHALGLGHEHQRSIFWRCIKPYTDIVKMKKDLGVTDKQLDIDWAETDSEEGFHSLEYDPDSVMHYWFKVEWLTEHYSVKQNIETDHDRNVLTDPVAKALFGVHKRHENLADEPSHMDIDLLKKAYGGIAKKSAGASSTVPPGTRVGTDSDDIVTVERNAGNHSEIGAGTNGMLSGGQSEPTLERDYVSDNTSVVVGAPNQKANAAVGEPSVPATEQENTSVKVAATKQNNIIEEQSEPMSEQGTDIAGAAPVPPSPLVQPVNGWQSQVGRLHIDDLYIVKNELWSVRAYWKNIGEALGVKPGSIVAVGQKCRDNPDECFSEIISTWLRGAETPEKPITWARLASALEQGALKETCEAIGAEIRRKHIVQ